MAKKILFYRWKAYNYLDIRQAFEKEGYEVTEVYQKLESYDIDRAFAAELRHRPGLRGEIRPDSGLRALGLRLHGKLLRRHLGCLQAAGGSLRGLDLRQPAHIHVPRVRLQ